MTQHQIDELLSQQADRLTAGPEAVRKERAAGSPSVERAGLPQDDQRLLGELMQLARRVQAGLVEVEPRPVFVSDMKARLIAQRQAARQPVAAAGRGMLWVAGVAGALTLAGLGFISYRAARAGAGWLSAASTGRSARAALPKA